MRKASQARRRLPDLDRLTEHVVNSMLDDGTLAFEHGLDASEIEVINHYLHCRRSLDAATRESRDADAHMWRRAGDRTLWNLDPRLRWREPALPAEVVATLTHPPAWYTG